MGRSTRIRCRFCRRALLEEVVGEVQQPYRGRLVCIDTEVNRCPLCDRRQLSKVQLERAIRRVKEKSMKEH